MGAIPARRELVTTDTSLSGWGAVWRGRTAQGRWSAQEGTQHINVLELRAVQLALACFLPHLAGRHVLVRSDNMSTVSQVNHQGGTRSAPGVPEPVDLGVSPSGQPAGSLFTGGQESGRGRIAPSGSPGEATSPLGQDALAHDWPDRPLYAFPPLPLILPTLQRVLLQGHRLLLVAPFWPGRLWYPLLLRLCCSAPWRLPDTAEGSDLASRPLSPPALGLATAGPDPLLRDCTAAVRGTVLSARAPSTRLQYENRWKLFSNWCAARAVDPVHCTVATVLEFLQFLLDSGRSHSTLKVYVVAISSLHDGVEGTTVGRHRLVSLFLRGALRLHPPTAMRAPAWDLPLVLEAL